MRVSVALSLRTALRPSSEPESTCITSLWMALSLIVTRELVSIATEVHQTLDILRDPSQPFMDPWSGHCHVIFPIKGSQVRLRAAVGWLARAESSNSARRDISRDQAPGPCSSTRHAVSRHVGFACYRRNQFMSKPTMPTVFCFSNDKAKRDFD